jgi:FG-GAP repeat
MQMRRLVVVFVLILAGALLGASQALSQAAPAAATDTGSLRADFNHDGFADLAVGVPQDRIGGVFFAGAVNVFYGSADGLSSTGSRYFSQNTPGVGSTAEVPDSFGSALAAGDFDHDGYADLAVGVPNEGVGDIPIAGAVNVLYGSAGGLTAVGSQYFTQNSPGVGSSAEDHDFFGSALAAGDFDHDGFADLAVGVPSEDQVGIGGGAVNVLFGSADGLTGTGSQLVTQDTTRVGSREDGDGFGSALTAGDFGFGGADDLVVGVRGEDVDGKFNAGAVNVLAGSAGGLTSSGSQYFTQNTSGVAGSADVADSFGSALAAGDFDHDGFADLAVGVPFESFGSIVEAGAVNVLYGSADGLSAAGGPLFTQDTPGVANSAGTDDRFGHALAAGDFDQDGFADLAVGVPGERVGSIDGAGAVNLLYGSADGLSGAASQFFTQNTSGVGSSAELFDGFGAALAGGDFNHDGADDLVVGVPSESVGSIFDAGAVNVVYGSAGGLSGAGSQFFTQETGGVGGIAESSDLFGFALAASGP